jgi:hypothetical protein
MAVRVHKMIKNRSICILLFGCAVYANANYICTTASNIDQASCPAAAIQYGVSISATMYSGSPWLIDDLLKPPGCILHNNHYYFNWGASTQACPYAGRQCLCSGTPPPTTAPTAAPSVAPTAAPTAAPSAAPTSECTILAACQRNSNGHMRTTACATAAAACSAGC